MPTFIDESGDTGDCDAQGKPYFRLAAVWVRTHDVADRIRAEIQELRRGQGLSENFEFKFAWTHQHPERRTPFFISALRHEFRFAVSSIDKTHPDWKSQGSRQLHRACATETAALPRPIYCEAETTREKRYKDRILVDDNRDAEFSTIVKRQFRGLRPELPLVGKVAFRESAADEMIQLADMICGAVGALFEEGDRTWYDLIAERDVEIR